MDESNQIPRLRDGARRVGGEPYPLGEIPDDVVVGVARYLTYLLAMGRQDIGGDDWGDAFAHAIDGEHLAKPLGIADVIWKKMAWSTKTVKVTSKSGPHAARKVRLISGRNSPDYSMGITDLHADIEATGKAVLQIWNHRVSIAQGQYTPIRGIVLLRSEDCLDYTMFEDDNHRFNTADYHWTVNGQGNLIGTEITSGITKFTWQFHGAQFTVHATVPADARKFSLQQPPIIDKADVLRAIDYGDNWVSFVQ